MIEDIAPNHPDHERIVDALNAERCPDCSKTGFDLGPRGGLSRNIFCRACGAGFNVAPPAPTILFVQRISTRRRI